MPSVAGDSVAIPSSVAILRCCHIDEPTLNVSPLRCGGSLLLIGLPILKEAVSMFDLRQDICLAHVRILSRFFVVVLRCGSGVKSMRTGSRRVPGCSPSMAQRLSVEFLALIGDDVVFVGDASADRSILQAPALCSWCSLASS